MFYVYVCCVTLCWQRLKKSPVCHSALLNLMADSQIVDVYVTVSHMFEECLLFFKMNCCHTVHHIHLLIYCKPELSRSHCSVQPLINQDSVACFCPLTFLCACALILCLLVIFFCAPHSIIISLAHLWQEIHWMRSKKKKFPCLKAHSRAYYFTACFFFFFACSLGHLVLCLWSGFPKTLPGKLGIR